MEAPRGDSPPDSTSNDFPPPGMKSRQTLSALVGSALVLIATAGIGWGLLAYKSGQIAGAKSKPAPAEVVESVRIDPVQESEFRQSTSAIGTVVAPQWMTVRTESSGRINALHVGSGQTVKKGDLLLELDCSVEIASRKAAQAKLNMATRALKRLTGLSESGAVSSTELEQSQFDKESAEAEIERLDAVIAKRSLRAPYDARVGLINVSVGQYLPEALVTLVMSGMSITDPKLSPTIARLTKSQHDRLLSLVEFASAQLELAKEQGSLVGRDEVNTALRQFGEAVNGEIESLPVAVSSALVSMNLTPSAADAVALCVQRVVDAVRGRILRGLEVDGGMEAGGDARPSGGGAEGGGVA